MRKLKEKIGEKIAKKAAKKTAERVISSDGSTGGESDGESLLPKKSKASDSDGESSGTSDSKGSKWQRFKKKISTKSKRKTSSSSNTSASSDSTDNGEDDGSESEPDVAAQHGLKAQRRDEEFGKATFVDTDKKMTWHILVRVIEGRDLVSGALRVRAYIDGRSKTTRACSEGVPKWRQNLTFTQKQVSLEKLAGETLTLKLTRAGRIREHVEGLFTVLLSALIHTPNKTVISRWVALRSPFDDEDDAEGENCGFLKVSLCIYAANEGAPHLNDDLNCDEVWSGAQLEQHTLRLRIFRIHHPAKELQERVASNKKKKPILFFVRVHIGKSIMECTAKELGEYDRKGHSGEVVSIEEEMYIPIDWPSVVQKIRFDLFMKQGRRKRCLGQASIPLRALYEPGETGFMPTFGPSFVNFYGHEKLERLKFFKERHVIEEGVGSKYLARLLLSVESVEFMGDSCQLGDMAHGPIAFSHQFEEQHPYKAICSFAACNQINPLYASQPVSFHLSIGDYGSTHPIDTNYRGCTFSTMPDTDHHKYFFMPWGNYRPVADATCLWEDVENRIERYNALTKVVSMLEETLLEMSRSGAAAEVASLAAEALDHADDMMDRLRTRPDSSKLITELDRFWESVRCELVTSTMDELDGVRFECAPTPEDVAEKATRVLTRLKDTMIRVANDVEISLPAVIIKMVAGPNVVGYIKINPADIFYHLNEAFEGKWCGQLRAWNLKWPSQVNRHSRKEEFPAVLHARIWFGRRSDAKEAWGEITAPAEMKAYLEVYKHERQSKLKMKSKWKPWDGPLFSDEHGSLDLENTAKRDTYAWEHLGNWVSRTSHDMWICTDTGRPTVTDRVYQVEELINGDWKHYAYTDYYGGDPEHDMKEAPKGWEYCSEKWSADKHLNNGDKHGWVYSIYNVFWGEQGTVDRECRPAHRWRRRCISRRRRAVHYNKEHEDLEKYEQSLGPEAKFEFAKNFKAAWHVDDVCDANVRRRRFLIEVQRQENLPAEREHENFYLPRLYEVHHVTTTWQLRCYVFWGKDLLPIVKNSARAFSRITFLTRCQQTLVVINSQNPIWLETLVFDKIPIPGGKKQISVSPPTVIVEVRGERDDDGEVFLGRFEVTPVVVGCATDARASPRWHSLQFAKGKTRGAVLACFELLYMDPTKDWLPLMPMGKHNAPKKFEVPAELKPKFERFAVQMLCWGVRNLSRYKLLTVKRPFLEIIIGDEDAKSDTLANAAKDPNFKNPFITIKEVKLPASLELCPPLVVNMHDCRAFKRKPLVGVCHISNFTRYIRQPTKKDNKSLKTQRDAFAKLLENEEKILANTNIISSLQREGEPRIDWWSKYYASQKLHDKAPGFEETGIEHVPVFKYELEKVNGYNDFTDFLDTFTFVKSSKGNFDDPEEKEKTGELKGKLFITCLEKGQMELLDPPGVEFIGLTKCLVRVYVVEAFGLQSVRRSGLCDPYVFVRIGKQKVKLKKNYRPDTVEPVFGELIEFEVTIPLEKDLIITLMDRRRLLPDEELGSTTIDLENRLLTKWRGTIGLSKQYTIHGELAWRDQLNPLMQLDRYCKKMLIPPPAIVNNGSDIGLKFLGVDVWYSTVCKIWQEEDKYFNPDKKPEEDRQKAGAEDDPKSENINAQSENRDGKEDQKDEDEAKEKPITKQPDWDDEPGHEKGDAKPSKWSRFKAWGETNLFLRKKPTLIIQPKKVKTPAEIREERASARNRIIGRPLQCVALHIMTSMNLVPEHVETRTLKSAVSGNVNCGELRCFVDLFPHPVGPIPQALDISRREPDQYQLRVAVFNVAGAIAVRRSFGEAVNDIYVKVFVNGMQKPQKTDVHYRSLDGDGEFNYRMIMDIDFNPWERKVVAYRKTRMFRKPREELVEPLLIVQLWDKRAIKKDILLGEYTFDLIEFPEGVSNPEAIKKFLRTKKKKQGCCSCSRRCCMIRCCTFCIETRCGCKFRKTKQDKLPVPPRYIEKESDHELLSLFDAGTVRGWWPMLNEDPPREKPPKPKDKAAAKKKDDDYTTDDEQNVEGATYLMGLVEMEITLLPLNEALADPVGKKRKDPNHSPYLPKPHRSKWNAFWITSRIKPCVHWCWHKFGIQILMWALIILLVVAVIWSLVNCWPQIASFFADLAK